MHDPCTVAHEIKYPWKDKNGYKERFLTIYHIDPEKDGTDDSCGWFIRARHSDKELLEKIVSEFEFNFKHNYWFTHDGIPVFSTSGVVLNMYKAAAWKYFMWKNNDYPSDKAFRQYNKFMRKYLYDILIFAENPVDSLHTSITQEYRYRLIEHDRSQVESREERIRHFAVVVYTDILRKLRPWYKHPKWHIRHWKIQFHPWQNLKRRYWDKCCVCGKRGFKGSAMSDWDGTKLWHPECDRSAKAPIVDDNLRETV